MEPTVRLESVNPLRELSSSREWRICPKETPPVPSLETIVCANTGEGKANSAASYKVGAFLFVTY